MIPLFMAVFLLGAGAQDGTRYPSRPGPREFIADQAGVIQPDDATEIRILCDEVLSRKQAPVVVVTIPSLASLGASAWPIERYAMNLMDEWGVGWKEWNYGMLLLVSVGDRKARIELGGSWERRKDEDAKRVMSERVIPYFRQGQISKGILEGVRGLHDIALDVVPSRSQPRRGSPAPGPQGAPGVPSAGGGCLPGAGCGLIALVAVAVVGFMVVSRLLGRGSVSAWGHRGPYGGGYGGYGGGFGGGFGGGLLGGALGSMLGNAMSRRSDAGPPPPSVGGGDTSSSSSDFGGGSFGGGFSGGGGATGEW
jgi:uncharacterized protein